MAESARQAQTRATTKLFSTVQRIRKAIEYRTWSDSARKGFAVEGAVVCDGDQYRALVEEWAICVRMRALANRSCPYLSRTCILPRAAPQSCNAHVTYAALYSSPYALPSRYHAPCQIIIAAMARIHAQPRFRRRQIPKQTAIAAAMAQEISRRPVLRDRQDGCSASSLWLGIIAIARGGWSRCGKVCNGTRTILISDAVHVCIYRRTLRHGAREAACKRST